MSDTEIGLMAAGIGAVFGLLTRAASSYWHNSAERKKQILNAISEERRLAYKIRLNVHLMYENDIDVEYHYELTKIPNINRKEFHLDKHWDCLDIHKELFKTHSDLVSEYAKNVHHFMLLTFQDIDLMGLLRGAMYHKFDDNANLSGYTTFDDLYAACMGLKKELKNKADNFENRLNAVNQKMMELLKRKDEE